MYVVAHICVITDQNNLAPRGMPLFLLLLTSRSEGVTCRSKTDVMSDHHVHKLCVALFSFCVDCKGFFPYDIHVLFIVANCMVGGMTFHKVIL